MLCFHSPLIEPDMRICRIRLADKDSCVRRRRWTRPARELKQPVGASRKIGVGSLYHGVVSGASSRHGPDTGEINHRTATHVAGLCMTTDSGGEPMSWFPDLGNFMSPTRDHIQPVGWLSAAHAFPAGDVPAEFVTRLREFVTRWAISTAALGWGTFKGLHLCDVCGQFMAGGTFGVPSGGSLFTAPEMISHYVEFHRYRPPDEFIAAVLQSPLPGTLAYQKLTTQYQGTGGP
jgi:hypothetical protein